MTPHIRVPDISPVAQTVADGDHGHVGLYEPADASILGTPVSGMTVQGYAPVSAFDMVAHGFKFRLDNSYTSVNTTGGAYIQAAQEREANAAL